MKISLFIVDDHYMVIEGIRSLLQNEEGIEWMGHATNAASCLAFLRMQKPDVIFMDVNLPDMSGTELCKQVKVLYPQILILGLSTFNQQSVVRNMMDNGASGYVIKNATKEELLTALHTVMAGRSFISREAAAMLRNTDEEVPVISRREKEILVLISDGLKNSEIAEKLFISVFTVNTHRKSLLAKFKVNNTAGLLKQAIKYDLL
ncbi:MAG: response regulator transcription factor [Chitinophagaceae bacterium]|nr:response regulator transcription factor [Bacteroidota bacterium]MCC6258492.1 response regulator transcription factor [Chitinophagaceae bacterium]MCW5918046.1 response regulator transcription factor [Ferruginibacter sp.]